MESENTSRKEKFVRLAKKRVEKVRGAIQSVAKLSDRKNYSYTDEQVEDIISALKDDIEDLKVEFNRNKRQIKKTFEFREG